MLLKKLKINDSMKKQNNSRDDVIYRHPPGVTGRSRRRGHRILNFNHRAPEYRAMKAHLRASAYEKDRESGEPLLRFASGGSVRDQPVPSFLQLHRSYGEQASRDFVRDGILLAVFAALSAWSIIHAIQAMAG